jgi:hypothetical protein
MALKCVVCVVVSAMLELSMCGQAINNNDIGWLQYAAQTKQDKIANACSLAMTNIQYELQKLYQQFTPLSDIGSASIIPTDHDNIRLSYAKNVRYVHLQQVSVPPGALLRATFSADKRVVDKDGAVLSVTIYKADHPEKVDDVGPGYPLAVNGKGIAYLTYSLQLNSTNLEIEKAVKDIIEKQVDILRRKLQKIIGTVSPQKGEEAQVFATEMTNILSRLEEIRSQFPLLSNLNTATIENKGTNYVYQHLRYWVNASGPTETNNATNQESAFYSKPVVESGGMALDVYVLARDEPFGFDPKGFALVIENGKPKVVLTYRFSYNRHDEDYKTPDGQMRLSTRRAVEKLIEDEEQPLRKKLDKMISF